MPGELAAEFEQTAAMPHNISPFDSPQISKIFANSTSHRTGSPIARRNLSPFEFKYSPGWNIPGNKPQVGTRTLSAHQSTTSTNGSPMLLDRSLQLQSSRDSYREIKLHEEALSRAKDQLIEVRLGAMCRVTFDLTDTPSPRTSSPRLNASKTTAELSSNLRPGLSLSGTSCAMSSIVDPKTLHWFKPCSQRIASSSSAWCIPAQSHSSLNTADARRLQNSNPFISVLIDADDVWVSLIFGISCRLCHSRSDILL